MIRSAGKCHVWRHKIRLKRRITMRSGKVNQPLNFKTAIDRVTNIIARSTKFYLELLFYFSLHPSFLNVFLWRHTWPFPALQWSEFLFSFLLLFNVQVVKIFVWREKTPKKKNKKIAKYPLIINKTFACFGSCIVRSVAIL